MEPMTLGSPVGSPPSPSGVMGTASPFLPAYLMGESTGGTGSRSKATSPTKPQKHVTFGTTPMLSSPGYLPGYAEAKGLRNIHLALSPTEKSNGPPTKGLFDTLDETFASPKPSESVDTTFREMNDSIMNIASPGRYSGIHNRSGRMSSSERFSSNVDETWVTVFGFPPLATSFIATQFSRYGTIVDKRVPPKGNWIHLHYRTPMEARKALNCNGKVYPGSIMVGVKCCQDSEILKLSSQTKENKMLYEQDSSSLNDSYHSNETATPTSPFPHNSTFGTSSHADLSNFSYLGTPVRISSVRPLNQAYRTAQAQNEVQGDSNTPQKSNSMMTRAMEYVFGW